MINKAQPINSLSEIRTKKALKNNIVTKIYLTVNSIRKHKRNVAAMAEG